MFKINFFFTIFFIDNFKLMKTKLNDKIVLENINSLCKELNLTFIGFNNEKNEYENHKTKLILKCNICGHIWE